MGGFFKNPVKAFKGFVNKVIPGGKYLTGADTSRQKRLYNASLNQYNNYATTAQDTLTTLKADLEKSMETLRLLDEKRYQANLRGEEIGREVSEHSRQYETGLKSLEKQKSSMTEESNLLKQAFESFKQKAPGLEERMSEMEKLPGLFQDMYDKVAKQKESLKGLTEEEAASPIKKYQQEVEALRANREQTENRIRQQMESIVADHRNLSAEKSNIENTLASYKLKEDQLLQESSNFENYRQRLTGLIQGYKDEQTAQDKITADYKTQETQCTALKDQLKNYGATAQTQLDAYGKELEWRGSKYKKSANLTGLVQGVGLAALTYGAGNLAFPALKSLAPVAGIAHYMNKGNIGHKLRNSEGTTLSDPNYDGYSLQDLSQLARLGGSGEKLSMPELGGLKQSVEHFNMKSVPRLKDLPKLHEALGKIVSLKDIEGLSLGLPGMTSASGKKYSHEVLYNSDFISKLRKVSGKLGMPYLKYNHNANKPNIGAA